MSRFFLAWEFLHASWFCSRVRNAKIDLLYGGNTALLIFFTSGSRAAAGILTQNRLEAFDLDVTVV